jgi:mannose-6-phosphate isomerase
VNYAERFRVPPGTTVKLEDIDPSFKNHHQAHKKAGKLYPLRFEPIYQYRLWGGRRLASLCAASLPGDGPIGEAWLLSDRDEHSSKVAAGSLKGSTIRQLMEQRPEQLLGKLAGRFQRFPVLLKFLDAHEKLSVQVHPQDGQTEYIPAGESGKSEAWVVLEAARSSNIYAGLKRGTTEDDLEQALKNRAVADLLAGFTPMVGDAVFIRAGTVHSLSDVVVFEVQENSDVTFRLYEWDRVDPATGKPRPLQVEQAVACIDFDQVAIGPVAPLVEKQAPVRRERLFHCEHFSVWRHTGQSSFTVGAANTPRVLVCISGQGELEHGGTDYPVGRGDVVLLPAEVGACSYLPNNAVTLLEVALPE